MASTESAAVAAAEKYEAERRAEMHVEAIYSDCDALSLATRLLKRQQPLERSTSSARNKDEGTVATAAAKLQALVRAKKEKLEQEQAEEEESHLENIYSDCDTSALSAHLLKQHQQEAEELSAAIHAAFAPRTAARVTTALAAVDAASAQGGSGMSAVALSLLEELTKLAVEHPHSASGECMQSLASRVFLCVSPRPHSSLGALPPPLHASRLTPHVL